MLERFRVCYPTGCLISELITIYHGKYVVRVLVQVDGKTLSTGLGSADTIELAEDQARERSLATLSLDKSISTSKTSVEFSVDRNQQHLPQINHYVNTSLPPTITKSPVAEVNLDSEQSSHLSTVSSELEKVEISTAPETEELPSVESTINYNDVSFPSSNVSGFDDNSWLNTEYITKEKEEKNETTEELVELTNEALSSEINLSQSIDYQTELAQETDTNNQEISSLNLQEDVSDDNVKIDILIDSLGWTKEQEWDWLEQNYHQKTRSFLTPEELSNFHQYLDLLLKVTKEIKGQGWKAKQQKDYLQHNLNKEFLEQLSVDELENFLNYLEVFGQTTTEIKRLGWNATQGKTYLKKNYQEEGRTRLSYEQLQDFLNNLKEL
ncbi:MAG: hypothetical protein AB4080_05385 [Trichodesmium sp.]